MTCWPVHAPTVNGQECGLRTGILHTPVIQRSVR
jgi:hypothetical protein